MAIRQVGSRKIVVDGVAYRWRIPPRSTYRQECHRFPLLVFVWPESDPNRATTFVGGLRADAVYGPPEIVTPRRMAHNIRKSLANPEQAHDLLPEPEPEMQ
jgi:hypothetical protein